MGIRVVENAEKRFVRRFCIFENGPGLGRVVLDAVGIGEIGMLHSAKVDEVLDHALGIHMRLSDEPRVVASFPEIRRHRFEIAVKGKAMRCEPDVPILPGVCASQKGGPRWAADRVGDVCTSVANSRPGESIENWRMNSGFSVAADLLAVVLGYD